MIGKALKRRTESGEAIVQMQIYVPRPLFTWTKVQAATEGRSLRVISIATN